jgi:hypothetical protein
MTARDRNRINSLREQAKRLRQIEDELTAESNTLEAELAGAPLLCGRRIVDAAVAILTVTPGHVMHYKDLLGRIEARSGMRVRGVDPAATLLAALDRDPQVRAWGDRSGRYLLAPELRLVA